VVLVVNSVDLRIGVEPFSDDGLVALGRCQVQRGVLLAGPPDGHGTTGRRQFGCPLSSAAAFSASPTAAAWSVNSFVRYGICGGLWFCGAKSHSVDLERDLLVQPFVGGAGVCGGVVEDHGLAPGVSAVIVAKV